MAGWEFGLECEVEWFLGSWMSRQRCVGRLGEKAEFPYVFFVGGRMSDYGIIFGIVLDDFQGDAWYGYYIL